MPQPDRDDFLSFSAFVSEQCSILSYHPIELTIDMGLFAKRQGSTEGANLGGSTVQSGQGGAATSTQFNDGSDPTVNDGVGSGNPLAPTPAPSTPIADVTSSSSTTPVATGSATDNGALTSSATSIPTSTGSSNGQIAPDQSSPSSTPTQNATESHRGWQNPGAVAGIAIASAIIGAALAAFICVLIFRRRRRGSARERNKGINRRQTSLDSSERSQQLVKNDKDMAQYSAEHRGLGPAFSGNISPSIDALLPQQEDDASIRQCCLLIFDQIELHVYNFYSEKGLRHELSTEQQAELSWFGTSTLTNKVPALPELLQRSNEKAKVIQHCLAYYAVRLVASPTSSSSETIYPQQLASVLSIVDSSLSTIGQHAGTESKSSDLLAKARWRQLTAYLKPELFKSEQGSVGPTNAVTGSSNAPVIGSRRHPRKDNSNLTSHTASQANANRNDRVSAAAKRFTSAFAPFAAQDDAENFSLRVDHLTEVLHSALQMALWLFKEPATFCFDWDSSSSDDAGNPRRHGSSTATAPRRNAPEPHERGSSIELMMMPGLRKTHDANGAVIAQGGLSIVAPVVERVTWRR
jgi:hypothetical protein